MLSQRASSARSSGSASAAPASRFLRRRYATETEGGFKVQDNAFNRERAAAKAHAAGSVGTCRPFASSWRHWADLADC